MNWSDSFITGFDIIDQQHRRLVDMVNEAAAVLVDNRACDTDLTRPLLDGLVDYALTHFATEDGMMVSQGIDARHLEHHRGSHATFAEQVTHLRQQFDQGGGLNGNALLRFLSNWLVFHILGEDQRMTRELKAIASGLSAAVAYEHIEGTQSDLLRSANDVLVEALVDLFTQMTEQNRMLGEKNRNIEAAHQELDAYRQNLEHQVNSRTADLQRANEALTEARDAAQVASRAKSRFLGIMGHELLTPLNAIVGFAHLLERADIPLKQHDQANRILRAGEQLNLLLNEVLLFARLDADEVKVENINFRPAELLSQVAESCSISARDKGIEVAIDVEPSMPALMGDFHYLQKIMEALASNAVKFTERGSVTLTARALEQTGQQVKVALEVRDTGIGIPSARQALLFRAFEQLDDSTTRRHGGIGLGLMVCARLADLMDGKLTVESTVGAGSTFRLEIWLNLAAATASSATPAGQAGGEIDAIALQNGLESLEVLLGQDNMQARQAFVGLESELKLAAPEQAAALAREIGNYDFQSALSRVRWLLDQKQL
jgi:hemerythrin-like metal-binding protein